VACTSAARSAQVRLPPGEPIVISTPGSKTLRCGDTMQAVAQPAVAYDSFGNAVGHAAAASRPGAATAADPGMAPLCALDGEGRTQLLVVTVPGVRLTISNFALRNGAAPRSGGASPNGGAFWSPAGTNTALTAQSVLFVGNSAYGNGGAVYATGTFVAAGCRFLNNRATASATVGTVGDALATGGAVAVASGGAFIASLTLFQSNVATVGGAVATLDTSRATVSDCTFTRNVAVVRMLLLLLPVPRALTRVLRERRRVAASCC
jgi:predicted outer membrane repeat protein